MSTIQFETINPLPPKNSMSKRKTLISIDQVSAEPQSRSISLMKPQVAQPVPPAGDAMSNASGGTENSPQQRPVKPVEALPAGPKASSTEDAIMHFTNAKKEVCVFQLLSHCYRRNIVQS